MAPGTRANDELPRAFPRSAHHRDPALSAAPAPHVVAFFAVPPRGAVPCRQGSGSGRVVVTLAAGCGRALKFTVVHRAGVMSLLVVQFA